MQAPKNGFFYVIDRADRRAAVGGQVRRGELGLARRHEDRPSVEIPGADYKDKGTYVRPGPLGGHNWQAMSFSPKTGPRLSAAQDNGRYFEQQGKWNPADFKAIQSDPTAGNVPYNLALGPIDRNMEKYEVPYKGRLLAWDPVGAQAEVDVEYGAIGTAARLATAGNLVFQGTAAGDFIAYNATTGRSCGHRGRRPASSAPPITYIDRREAIRVGDGVDGAAHFRRARELADAC
jgi:glucose dehydrogenase